jgi:hypothetical protein
MRDLFRAESGEKCLKYARSFKQKSMMIEAFQDKSQQQILEVR